MAGPQADVNRINLIRRGIYILVAAAVITPCLVEMHTDFEASSRVKRFYDKVDSLKPGSHVLLAFDFDPASKAELYPMSLALLRHCFKKDLVPIVVTHWPTGLGLCKQLCEKAAGESKQLWGTEKVSGRDYVLLGFRPGGSNLILNMGEDLKRAFAKDFYGKPTQDMEALQGVESLKDVDLGIDIAAGATVEMWIAYGSDLFGFPLGAGCTAVIAPDLYPFLHSKQLVSFLGGLRDAADYEQLLRESVEAEGGKMEPGQATLAMPPQSSAHALVIVLILAANVRFIALRLRRKRGG